MKIFSEEEQEIIRCLVDREGYSRNLINLIDSQRNLEGVRVKINKENSSVEFLFQSDTSNFSDDQMQYIIRRHKEISELIIRYVVLFRYLEKNDFAISFSPAMTDKKKSVFGMGAENRPFIPSPFYDKTISDLLIEYVDKEIIPSHSLRVLVSKNFVTEEERRFKKQICATWIAILVSFLIGISGIYMGWRSSAEQSAQVVEQIALDKASLHAIQASVSEVITAVNRSAENLESSVEAVRIAIESKDVPTKSKQVAPRRGISISK